jgi:hypothetical protein
MVTVEEIVVRRVLDSRLDVNAGGAERYPFV